jgi:putative serine protease PepD
MADLLRVVEPEPAAPAEPRPPARRRERVLVVAVVVLVLVLTALVAFRWGASGGSTTTTAPKPTPSPTPTPLTVAQVHATLQPSVVAIRATTPGSGVVESGAGLVANAAGLIITALHVVQTATQIEVAFADGTHSAATVTIADPDLDIAVLTPATLPAVVVPAVIGGSAAVGDQVVAIGNPLGLADSTTAGVVSGLGRAVGRAGAKDLTGLIQFDAAVNPGSSGGPLVNTKGQTVGIVVALANPTNAGTFIGIGFAVPIGAALAAGGAPQPQR